jgi:hypothetical protein
MAQVRPGTDATILRIFSPKNLPFLAQNYSEEWNRNIGFQENWQLSPKIVIITLTPDQRDLGGFEEQ